MEKIKIGRYSIKVSSLDKVFFPKAKITKGDLIEYYAHIAPIMLKYVKGRPITMVRYPEGIKGEGFYQKDTPDYFPRWIKRVAVKKSDGGVVNYAIIEYQATLVYLANQGCITPHIWLSKLPKLNYPDRLIFDLDPSGKRFDFSKVRITALQLKEFIESLGLVPFVMTTGSRGLHVVVPLLRKQTFNDVREFARTISEYFVEQYPDTLTLEMRKAKRGNKIFMDYLRNAQTATAVAPYAIRPKPGAPVATPIEWDEVEDKKLTSQRYNYKTVFDRLEKKGDVWADINKYARSLTRPWVKLEKIIDAEHN